MTPRKRRETDEIVQAPPAQLTEEPEGYAVIVENLKARVRTAQLRAALAVNRELILLYWWIGREILQQQAQEGWGAKVIDRLADDLRNSFPEMKGFSSRNLKYMRAFAEAYPTDEIVQAQPAQISWYHNTTLLDKVKDPEERAWYMQQALQYGWSRDVMVHQIDSGLHRRQGKAVTNFQTALPAPQSDLAHQLIKDPYIFDFLSLGPRPKSAMSSATSSNTSGSSCWSSAPASPSWGASTTSRWLARTSTSTCCSTT